MPRLSSFVRAPLLCLVAWGGLRAGEENARYATELLLADVVSGGRTRVLERETTDHSGGEVVYQPLMLDHGDFPLELKVVSARSGALSVARVNTRLTGRDLEWQEHEGMMWLVVRYLDELNRPVSSASFTRRGTSAGWNGLPQASRFHTRTDEAVVPERASKVQLLMVSGGTPRTTGFWAIRRMRLLGAAGASDTFVALYTLDSLRGTSLESPQGIPHGWTRDGTSLGTPQIFNPGGAGSAPMLALVDADPDDTGGWLATTRTAIAVQPGMRLRLECEEIHSIGRGSETTVVYQALPVGSHVFRARATDELGRPTGRSLSLPIQVLPPFYQTTAFRLVTAGLGIVLLLGIVRYLTWRKVQRQLQRLERRRAVEEERTRLARDIHDEMGSRLTQISLLAARALPTVPSTGAAHEPIRQIHGAVRELATALGEIVWAANPTMDTLEGLGNYLSQYAGGVLRDAGLRCRLEIPTLLPARPLSSGTRHRLMMAVKEALTNALKHANATEVRLRLSLVGNLLEIRIEDDGRGFALEGVAPGNGLGNMRNRLEEAGGACHIESDPGQGTRVTLTFPLPPAEEGA